MAEIAPQIPLSRPSWGRIALALAIALVSDGFSFFTSALVIAEPIVIAVDLVTAIAIWAALGAPMVLLAAFIAEAIPGVGMIPIWSAVVVALAFTGRLPGRNAPAPPVQRP